VARVLEALSTLIPTVIGLIVGAVAAFIASALSERTKWRRERAARLDDRRTEAYAEYGQAMKSMFHLCLRLTASRGIFGGGVPLSIEEADPLLRKADHERSVKWETVLLVGSTATIKAGQTWQALIWRLENIAREDSSEDTLWPEILEMSSQARSAFYASARADLGIVDRLPGFAPMQKSLDDARHKDASAA
jgi:hypothetical protein